MSRSNHHLLIEDTLHPDGFADSLATLRRAARRRRIARRTTRAAAALALAAIAALILIRSPRSDDFAGPAAQDTPAPTPAPPAPHAPPAAPATPAACLVVTTKPAAPGLLIQSAKAHDIVVRTTPGVQSVSSRQSPAPLPRATEDDLFAAAGSRPAALHRLPDGKARWLWLDQEQH